MSCVNLTVFKRAPDRAHLALEATLQSRVQWPPINGDAARRVILGSGGPGLALDAQILVRGKVP